MSDGQAPVGDPDLARAREGDPVSALEGRLGVPLVDRAVALAALTHKSYVNEHRDEAGLTDNERLEFLGDAVIDLAVSHRLMERFPTAREGDLSKMRAAVVDEQGLSEMARALDLGRGEELTGGRQKASLLADAMEAVVAAVFVGSGLAAVLRIVDRFLGEAFARAAAGTLDRDYKTQLQELAQSRLRATPRYRVVAEHGPDHSKTFEVETDLKGELVGRGMGRSKKDAEQAAARLALDALGRRFATATQEPALAVAAEPAAASPAAARGEPAPEEAPFIPEPPAPEEPPAAVPAPPAAADATPAPPAPAPEPRRKRPRAARAPAKKARRAAAPRAVKKVAARKGRRGRT